MTDNQDNQPAKKGYKEQIKELLSQYENGETILIDAADWDHPITIKDDATMENLPTHWLGLSDRIIEIIAHEKYGLDTYQNQYDFVGAGRMIDAYVSVGMPVGYNHWSFGKSHIQQEHQYRTGKMGLAYELVLNTEPCINYLLETNSKTMMLLVQAHAAQGHNSFFKGNELFKQYTRAETILSDLESLKGAVEKYEERYGIDAVEEVLDACHALKTYGVDRAPRSRARTQREEQERQKRREELQAQSAHPFFDSQKSLPRTKDNQKAFSAAAKREFGFLETPEENFLYFIEKNAPHLAPWERDLVRRMQTVTSYFYPQRQTQVMNEGWASFWHYTIMADLRDLDLIDDGMYLAFLDSHSGVLFQPDFDSPYYSGSLNPYYLGFNMFQDIKRICENPTKEDKEQFPDLAGKDWLEEVKFAMKNFRDHSFIEQYLSSKVIRDLGLFSVHHNEYNDYVEINAIHDEDGYDKVRSFLSSQYNLSENEPSLNIVQYDYRGDMSLRIRHDMYNDMLMEPNHTPRILQCIKRLWKRSVILESFDTNGQMVDSYEDLMDQDSFKGRSAKADDLYYSGFSNE